MCVRYRCTKCKIEEEIPKEVVDMMHVMDGGDPSIPPRFSCEKCGAIMEPIDYIAPDGRKYGIE